MDSKNFWLSKNLSEKAALVLSSMGIDTFEDLVGSYISEDQLLGREMCEQTTCREIIHFRRRLLPTTNTSSKKVNRRAVEILKKISVNEIEWDTASFQLMRESGARNVYDLAMINLPAYQGLSHYNLKAYHIIKSKVFAILTEINSSFAGAHEEEDISLNIFVEKPGENGISGNDKKETFDYISQQTFSDNSAKKTEAPESTDEIDLQEMAGRLLKILSPEEIYVTKMSYGFNYRPRSEDEIAGLLQLVPGDIQHIRQKALYKLRDGKRHTTIRELEKLLQTKTASDAREKAVINWFRDILAENGKSI